MPRGSQSIERTRGSRSRCSSNDVRDLTGDDARSAVAETDARDARAICMCTQPSGVRSGARPPAARRGRRQHLHRDIVDDVVMLRLCDSGSRGASREVRDKRGAAQYGANRNLLLVALYPNELLSKGNARTDGCRTRSNSDAVAKDTTGQSAMAGGARSAETVRSSDANLSWLGYNVISR